MATTIETDLKEALARLDQCFDRLEQRLDKRLDKIDNDLTDLKDVRLVLSCPSPVPESEHRGKRRYFRFS